MARATENNTLRLTVLPFFGFFLYLPPPPPPPCMQVRFAAEMDLGDMFISLAYVNRQIARDREEAEEAAASAAASATKAGGAGAERGGIDVADSPDHEWWDEERGVSGAMSRVFDVQVRCASGGGVWGAGGAGEGGAGSRFQVPAFFRKDTTR